LPAIIAVAGFALAGGGAWALSLPPTNLVDLIRHSTTIIMGSVTTVTDGVNEIGIPYTEVTIAIDETLRGAESGTYTFRQFGLITPRLTADGTKKIPAAPPGIPRYNAGEQVLLFLGESASMTGLRSPVGLGYGKFVFGPGTAANDLANNGVFLNLSMDPAIESSNDARILSTSMGAVNDTDLKSLVRRAVELNYVETCQLWKTDEGKTCGPVLPKKPPLGRPHTLVPATTRTASSPTAVVK